MTSIYFKVVNNDLIIFPMSYEILKHSSWILLHLTNYTEHFKSKSTTLRTINLGQCPHFIVVKIVRNLTFSLMQKWKLDPKIHLSFNQKSKDPFPPILTMKEESPHVENHSGIRSPVVQHCLSSACVSSVLVVKKLTWWPLENNSQLSWFGVLISE